MLELGSHTSLHFAAALPPICLCAALIRFSLRSDVPSLSTERHRGVKVTTVIKVDGDDDDNVGDYEGDYRPWEEKQVATGQRETISKIKREWLVEEDNKEPQEEIFEKRKKKTKTPTGGVKEPSSHTAQWSPPLCWNPLLWSHPTYIISPWNKTRRPPLPSDSYSQIPGSWGEGSQTHLCLSCDYLAGALPYQTPAS